MADQTDKIRLHGFNNLTKALSFNIYDICYTQNEDQRREYIDYIDEEFNAQRLTGILTDVADIIGATVLNIAQQDYEPQGASVTVLIAEGPVNNDLVVTPPHQETVLAHLDKSHITVHTYPESHPDIGVSTFRVDIDVSTCGQVTPLAALDFLIGCFDSDVVTIDYRVRGFTRDTRGQKHFMDHAISSVQEFIDPGIVTNFRTRDANLAPQNLFHTRMMKRDLVLDDYLFGMTAEDLNALERKRIEQHIRREMQGIWDPGHH